MRNDCCPACQSGDLVRYPAEFSPFVSRRVFDGENKRFDFLLCRKCGFAFYSYRFSDEEAAKLYRHYRDDAYQRERQACESWYTKDINALIGNNEKELSSRHALLTSVLKESVPNMSDIKAVLDFGGDRGQFIPPVLHKAEKYVYDISDQPVNDGVFKLTDIGAEKEKRRFDLVLCAHVLEHVGDPNAVLETIKSVMKAGQMLYVELPFDSPFYKKMTENLQYLFNPHYSLKNIVRQYMRMKRTKAFLMHEHVNFFTKESVGALLARHGFDIRHLAVAPIKSETGNGKVISALAVLST